MNAEQKVKLALQIKQNILSKSVVKSSWYAEEIARKWINTE